MIRKFVQFILLLFCLCLCAFVCDDSPNLNEITVPPDTQGVVTDLTPEVWEKVRFAREFWMLTHLKGPSHFYWNLAGSPDYDPEKDKAWHDAEEVRIARIKELEEAFFNRYIDADGVSIIGNEMTHDKYFIIARDIFLMMTSKNPRLREPLRDHFYLCIVGGLEADHRLVTKSDESWTQLFPSLKYLSEINRSIRSANTCVTGGVALNLGTRTSSGLTKVRGWCLSCVFGHPVLATYANVLDIYVHEISHGLERVMRNIDPTWDEKRLKAHKNSDENDLWGSPTNTNEWWAGVTRHWFFSVNPEFTTEHKNPLYGSRFASHEDFAEYDPMTAALLRQWYPEISFTNLADNY